MSIFSHRIMTLGLTMTALTCTTGAFANHHDRKERRQERREERREERRDERQSRRSSRHSISISDLRQNCFPKPLVNRVKEEVSDNLTGWFLALNQIGEEWGVASEKDLELNLALAAFIAANEELEGTLADLIAEELAEIGVLPEDVNAIKALLVIYNTNALAYFACLNELNAPPTLDEIACSQAVTYAAFADAATNLGQALARISCDQTFISRIQHVAYLQAQLAQAALGVLVNGYVTPDDQTTEGNAQALIAVQILREVKSIGLDLAVKTARCQCHRLVR